MNNTQHSKFIQQRTRCHICAWGLLLLLPLLALPAVAQGQFSYTTNYDSTITITGYMGPGGAVTIPDTMHGLPVTSIGGMAFYNCIGLTSVTIRNSVTSIGDQAFCNCTNLTNVTIGNRVAGIGSLAFGNCINLANVSIPNSVTNIGGGAFYNCIDLTSVTIPSGVISIVVRPGEPGPFVFCTRLSAITVDVLNPAYTSLDGVLFNKDQTILIECPGAKAGSYTVPGSVTNIAYAAFAGCSSLTNVAVLSSVTSIGDWAFIGCTSLTGVAIPSSVASIGYCAFGGCITLSSITIPDSVTSLGDDAFSDCTNLTSVTIGNGVTRIWENAFVECGSLTNITLGNNVTSIGNDAFLDCISLTSVTIPNSVTSIGEYAFAGCSGLTGCYFLGNAPQLESQNVFYNDDQATVFYLPGTTGWGTTFGGRPTAPWYLPNPVILDFGLSFGVKTNQFGFIISWATNVPVVIEASTNLANPTWSPVATNTLISGTSYFSDPRWTNYPTRFYRLRSP
jgi:hypothetical protein